MTKMILIQMTNEGGDNIGKVEKQLRVTARMKRKYGRRWECIASHELVQSCVPASYATLFNVPQTRELTEWSLTGGKDAISSMHVDTEGFAMLVLVLEGSKYWVVVTQIGDDEDICSLDSLGPNWNPYLINEESNDGHY